MIKLCPKKIAVYGVVPTLFIKRITIVNEACHVVMMNSRLSCCAWRVCSWVKLGYPLKRGVKAVIGRLMVLIPKNHCL